MRNLKQRLFAVGWISLGAILFWMSSGVLRMIPIMEQQRTNMDPKAVAIPDEATAIAVGVAILKPVYGATIWTEHPFVATLTNSVWWVRGSLPSRAKGGVAEIFLSRSNAAVLDIYHSK